MSYELIERRTEERDAEELRRRAVDLLRMQRRLRGERPILVRAIAAAHGHGMRAQQQAELQWLDAAIVELPLLAHEFYMQAGVLDMVRAAA